MRIIYAISPDGRDSLSYHTPFSRGTRSIYLRQRIADVPNVPEDSVTIDITVEDVSVATDYRIISVLLMRHIMYTCNSM